MAPNLVKISPVRVSVGWVSRLSVTNIPQFPGFFFAAEAEFLDGE